MSVKINNSKVVYVEPNLGDEYTTYNSRNLGLRYKAPNLEDMCLTVDLEVEVKGRTYQARLGKNDTDVSRMSWQSDSDGERVSFMSGTKIHTKNLGDVYSLTTNYTNTNLFDIKDEGTSEMFGIKSIDINYNNYMVPEVTIKFVDVRGVSLFAQEEMRHNITTNGIRGFVNNDINGSFFKCFFTFPYPKFTLKVKGFYGQMVSYELTCSDFRAAFDSNTGNFDVTAKFIGYAFSFLNDVMVNALVAAPYSEYIGKKYWDDNVDNGRFFVYDSAGRNNVSMVRLGTIVSMYKEIQMKVAQSIKENGHVALMESLGYSEEDKTIVRNDDTTELRGKYKGIIDRLDELRKSLPKRSSENKTGEMTIRANGSHSMIFIVGELPDDIEKEFKSIIIEINNLNNEISSSYRHIAALDEWLSKGKRLVLKSSKFNFDEKPSTGLVSADLDEDGILSEYNAIKKQLVPGEKDEQYWELWRNEKTAYVYLDRGLWNILGREVEITADMQRKSNALKEEVEQRLIAEEFNNVFKFEPTVENITRIVMAHVETFVHMVSECASRISNMGTGRSVKNLGIPIDQFPDIGTNNATGCNEDTIVAPFPKVTHIQEKDGVKREEGEWLGNVVGATPDKFEEIKLVEGILNCIAEASNDFNRAVLQYEGSEPSVESSSLQSPLSYTDLFIKESESPWGQPDFTDINDVMGRFCMRAFVLLGAQKVNQAYAKYYGMVDADNFIDMFGKTESMDVIASMVNSNSLTWEKVSALLFKNAKIDESKNNLPWSTDCAVDMYNEKLCSPKIGRYNDKDKYWLMPVKDWNFTGKGGIESIAPYGGGLKDYAISRFINTSSNYSEDYTQIIEIVDNPVQFLKNSYNKTQNLSLRKYDENFVNDVFNEKDFSFDSFGDEYDEKNNGVGLSVLRVSGNNRTFTPVSLSKLNHDANGIVEDINDITISLKDIYVDDMFMSLEPEQRAEEFLHRVLPNMSENSILKLCEMNPQVLYVPRFSVASDVAGSMAPDGNFETNEIFQKEGVNPSIYRAYRAFLYKWTDEYLEFEKQFVLEPKDKWTIQDIKKRLKNWKGSGIDGDIEKLKIELKKMIKNPDVIDNNYFVMESTDKSLVPYGGIDLIPQNGKTAIMTFIKNAFSVTAVCTKTKFNYWDKEIYGAWWVTRPFVQVSSLQAYMEGVVTELSEHFRNYGISTLGTEANTSVTTNNDPDDIKAGVYDYIKLLYDKWIAADTEEDFYTMERMFYGKNQIFHFIDSVYTKIGKSIYLNLSSVVERIIHSQHNNGYTLLSLLSNMYADNKLLFLCIQNFLDMSDPTMMETVFKPVSYLDTIEPNNHPNFIVMFPYEPSSKLDVPGADFQDDGFYLNDERTWPELIKGKPDGNPIPAFGVSYGQQYQSYFKDIQVDMNAPMVTEQSIKAKFMIAGAYNDSGDNGTVPVTAGQDLYTIYANNSYTCTVTMMGCAWIQPMMYFVLQNIPMFHGSYMIVKVNHRIQPGNMVTVFKGIRMANTATRAVKRYLLGGIRDSVSIFSGDSYITPEANYANIANNCKYAYYDPKALTVYKFTDEMGYGFCNATYTTLRQAGLSEEQAKGICANIYQESSFNPFTMTIDHNESYTEHGVGGGLCGFYYHGRAKELFKMASGSTEPLDALDTEICNKYWDKNDRNKDYRKIIANDGLRFPVSYEDQMKYIVSLVKGEMSGITKCESETDAASYWMNNYEKPGVKTDRWKDNGKYVEHALYVNAKIPNITFSENTGIPAIAEGLRISCQESMRASEFHRDVNVTMEYDEATDMYVYKASGVNKNAALMDCLLEAYSQWFNFIGWNFGTGDIKGQPVSIYLDVVDKKPEKIDIDLRDEVSSVVLKDKDELNEDLRIILSKYFKNNGINSPEKVKSVFVALYHISDEDMIELFDLDNTKGTFTCDYVMGTDNTGIGEFKMGDGSYSVDAACQFLTAHAGVKQSACAEFVGNAINAGGIKNCVPGVRPKPAWKYIDFLPKQGFEHVASLKKVMNVDNPQKGDIAVYKKYGRTDVAGHICMYDGEHWVSDFVQKNMVVYAKPQDVDIFRYRKS